MTAYVKLGEVDAALEDINGLIQGAEADLAGYRQVYGDPLCIKLEIAKIEVSVLSLTFTYALELNASCGCICCCPDTGILKNNQLANYILPWHVTLRIFASSVE